jgi:hypothetical protein
MALPGCGNAHQYAAFEPDRHIDPGLAGYSDEQELD